MSKERKHTVNIAVLDKARGTVDFIYRIPSETAADSSLTRKLLFNMGYNVNTCCCTVLRGKGKHYNSISNGKDAAPLSYKRKTTY